MHILRIVGARPQFMQIPAFTKALTARGGRQTLVHTGQHYDDNMSRIFFEELGLPWPDVNLEVGSGSHGQQTARMLEKLEASIIELRPDVVVFDGDTNSTLAAALAARKLGRPTLHIEAGVRCGIRHQPEEINRIATDHLSDLLCAPTPSGLAYLAREGLSERAVLTGDVMLDCYMTHSKRADPGALERLGLQEGGYIVSTMHRAETTGDYDVMACHFDELDSLGKTVIFPAHPRLKAHVSRYLENRKPRHLRLIDPVGYLTMLALICGCDYIVTDSGGVTREGPFAGKPVVLAGESTAWVDLVREGYVVTWTPQQGTLTEAVAHLRRPDPVDVHALFGRGRAAERIVDAMYEKMG